MNVAWIALGLAVAAAIVVFATLRSRREQKGDLGTVSHQWMAEQRLGQTHDPHR